MILSYNTEAYEKRIEGHISDLLDSPLLKLHPYQLKDEEILDWINNRTKLTPSCSDVIGRFSDAECFASLVFVGDTIKNEYNGKTFKQIIFETEDGEVAHCINYSQFLYDMHPTLKIDAPLERHHSTPRVRCSVNNGMINPDIFKELKGKRLFIKYWFDAQNAFKKEMPCYRFSMGTHGNELSAEDLRRDIVESQWFLIKSFLKSPSTFTLPTVYFRKGKRFGNLMIGQDLYEHFGSYIEKHYAALFQDMLATCEQLMSEQEIVCIDQEWLNK